MEPEFDEMQQQNVPNAEWLQKQLGSPQNSPSATPTLLAVTVAGAPLPLARSNLPAPGKMPMSPPTLHLQHSASTPTLAGSRQNSCSNPKSWGCSVASSAAVPTVQPMGTSAQVHWSLPAPRKNKHHMECLQREMGGTSQAACPDTPQLGRASVDCSRCNSRSCSPMSTARGAAGCSAVTEPLASAAILKGEDRVFIATTEESPTEPPSRCWTARDKVSRCSTPHVPPLMINNLEGNSGNDEDDVSDNNAFLQSGRVSRARSCSAHPRQSPSRRVSHAVSRAATCAPHNGTARSGSRSASQTPNRRVSRTASHGGNTLPLSTATPKMSFRLSLANIQRQASACSAWSGVTISGISPRSNVSCKDTGMPLFYLAD